MLGITTKQLLENIENIVNSAYSFKRGGLTGNEPIKYELCPTDYTKKTDGVTSSDVMNASYSGNAMVKLPEYKPNYTRHGVRQSQ